MTTTHSRCRTLASETTRRALGAGAVALALSSLLGACTRPDEVPASSPTTPVVQFPSSDGTQAVDSSGQPLVAVPTSLPSVPLTGTRVRSLDYAYSVPAQWAQVYPSATPSPDSMIAPTDPGLPYYIAVDKPFRVQGLTQAEVVERLRTGFKGEGQVRPTWDRDIAGYTATGLLIEASSHTRHLYAIIVYAERVYPIRVTYDPQHEREALSAFESVLGSWVWT